MLSEPGSPPLPSSGPTRSERIAAWVFGIYVAVALPLVVLRLGRYFWFLGDDWDFLTDRQAWSPGDLMRPHAEHLSTLPILATRLEWHLFGFHYWRYQLVVMAFHLTTAVLLRLVMRRSGVGPWVASAAAASFVLFSPGYENMLWSFQLAWVMATTFGLLQLLAVDRSNPTIDRRDALGLTAGVCALLCAGIGPIFVAVAGTTALVKRGWRVAAFHTVGPAIAYAMWFLATRGEQPDAPFRITPARLVHWFRAGYGAIFEGLGSNRALGAVFLAFAIVALVGWVSAARAGSWEVLRQRAVVPVVMVGGGFLFQCLTARGRLAFGYTAAEVPRYVHVGALFMLPLVASGAQTLVDRWRMALPVVVVLLLAPIPANIAGFDPSGSVFNERYFDRQRTFVEAIAWSPLAEQVPRDSHPIRDIFGGEGPSVGWLLAAREDDRIPRPGPVSPEVQDELTIRLGIRQQFADETEPVTLRCRVHSSPLDLYPTRGDRLRLVTPVGVRLIDARSPAFFASKFDPAAGTELEIVLDDLQLRVTPLAPETTFELCQ